MPASLPVEFTIDARDAGEGLLTVQILVRDTVLHEIMAEDEKSKCSFSPVIQDKLASVKVCGLTDIYFLPRVTKCSRMFKTGIFRKSCSTDAGAHILSRK